MACLPRSRVLSSRSPLALSLALALSAPAFAAAAGDDPGDATHATGDQPQDLGGVTVVGQRYLPDYQARKTRGATKTDTDLLDVPQAVTVVTDKLIADQAMTSLVDTLRYMPGVGTAQGEGNRDTPVLRGNSTTGDFFVDGVRDDVQYIRDVYNVERVEALKGPNAMIFGRGGSGGVINRVTRQADGASHRAGSLQLGSGNRRRGTLDYGTGVGQDAGFRLNAVYEDSESFRDGFQLERYGINPTFGIDLGGRTSLQASYERFHDERVADRGVPSLGGRPLDVDPSVFFGDPAQSPVQATVDAFDIVLEHAFDGGASLRNHLRLADYDKFYQNVFPREVDAATQTVALAAYNNATTRRNLFNQTDLTWHASTGTIEHTLLAGAESGRQVTDNLRMTGYFGAPGSTATSMQVPLDHPTAAAPVQFRQDEDDADNHGVAKVAAVYLQDQIELSPRWQAIVGLRYDDFRVELRDNRSGEILRSDDGLLSPRAGLVYKPVDAVSLYASYSIAYQPRAGDQLSSLRASSAALDPETFRNREIGAKWDLRPDLSASIAMYRLDRGNVAVVDPADPTAMILVDGQTTKGVELGIAGRITQAWQLMGGYAYQSGELTSTQSPSALAGNRLAQLPGHSASLWNRYDFNPAFGAGLGIVHRGAIFANIDNQVTVPAFTRFDAALYWTLDPSLQLQLNIENITNKRYFASAHNNDNISPGAPRSAWLTLNFHY
ncbi:TonB-dependent siderophore receptor [Luteimonas sp. 50]|uniref:TonB-dependent siderophore receptor n=1 Tax=Cognatiluteimonas sedimenti TaxID=2927791 RepID=A0ABT0A4F0_9GAMM|nr:TonB-dependent siderophore receptor [Lysobacter sedimenti]MCJ0825847.1 TonB-dependent siderophore receptor [Lysobacter sedimenti]